MLPFPTDRLWVRMMREADAPALAAYRSDPDVARLQSWTLPYPEETARAALAEQADIDGPTAGRWAQLAIEHGGEVIGDLAVRMADGGGIAEIGFTLASAHQGKGFATEAADALVAALFARGDVHRVVAELHPDNVASMRVLEAVGLDFEVLTRLSYEIDGRWEDNLHYAVCADEYAAWASRPRGEPASVSLVEITPGDAHRWGELRTHHSQERFVAPMAASFRDALFPEPENGAPVVPWMRGVEADGARVAFVMLSQVTDHHPDPVLRRLLVDRCHQRRGIGWRVVEQLVEQLRDKGCRQLVTGYVGGVPGSPERFFRRLGFQPTGETWGEATVAALGL